MTIEGQCLAEFLAADIEVLFAFETGGNGQSFAVRVIEFADLFSAAVQEVRHAH